jgi:hypothetical protein
MMRWQLSVLLLFVGGGCSARAETVSCPPLSTAAQVAVCPSEEELKVTFVGYCSDDARPYDLAGEDTCVSYENYRRKKNVALWEAAGGDFQGYVSCDLASDVVQALIPTEIAVTRQGNLSRIVCSYAQGVTFVYRTSAQCAVVGSGTCAADAASCKANCER